MFYLDRWTHERRRVFLPLGHHSLLPYLSTFALDSLQTEEYREFSTGQEVWSVFERPENEAIVPVFDPQPLEAAAPCQNASGNPSAYSKVKLGSLDILSSVEPAPASPTTQGQFQEQRGRRAKRDNMDTATAAANEIGLDLMADANSLDPGLQLQIRRDEVACSNEQRAGLQGVGYCNKSLLQLPGGACMKP